ncbi:DNA polymerase III subunit beta [bacterium]|nr:DNA polymerase III subunit beta [bacterium]
MKIEIKKEDFLSGLRVVQTIADQKSTDPTLANVFIKTAADGINLIATDLEVGTKGFYLASVQEQGSITIPAKKTFEIVNELPDNANIKISELENNWINLVCEESNFKIFGLPSEEYPVFPEYDPESLTEFGYEQFKEMIRKTVFSIAVNEPRHTLNGLLVKIKDGKIIMVSSDGHRLSYIERPCDAKIEKTVSVVVPKKSIQEMLKIMSEEHGAVKIGFQKNHIVFEKDNIILVSRLISGEFPNFDAILDTSNLMKVYVNRSELVGAIRRVQLLAGEKTRYIKMTFSGEKMILQSNNPNQGEAKEDIKIQYPGEETSMGMNSRYLLEALTVINTEEVQLEILDHENPCVFKEINDNSYLSLVMPMRLQ